MKKPLAALAMGLALASAPIQKINPGQFALGISSPCHGILALRGIYDLNETIGVQGDAGLVFSSIDARLRKGFFYGYAGVVGISPWIYSMTTNSPDGPTFGADVGVGIESNPSGKGLSLGLEGGLIIPIPLEKNTMAFRIDANLMYRF